jgi:acetyl esterase/lipase
VGGVLLHAWISPLGKEFRVQTPFFVHTGTAEVMHDEHLQLLKHLKDVGNRVVGCVSERVTHDVFAGGPILGMEVEARSVMEKARDFLDSL